MGELSQEVVQWSSKKMREIDQLIGQQERAEDSLSAEIQRARLSREKAKQYEEVLLMIQRKIEQMRLIDLS